MLFNVEYDHGDIIEGYVIPDGFSGRSEIIVSDQTGDLVQLPCDQAKPAVVQSGRHETGIIGFKIDRSSIADLPERSTLVIRDAKTGIVVYRRPQGRPSIPLKVLRLETNLVPMARFDANCGTRFQYDMSAVERYGHETTIQVLLLHGINSIYLSGRLLLRNYEEYFDKGFRGITYLSDPYYEMAMRIFLLKRMAKTHISFLGERDQILLGPAAEYFAEVDLTEVSSLRAHLKKAPPKVQRVLASPITRQLVCTSPEQLTSRRELAAAVGLLSRFTIVGHDTDPSHFRQAVFELIGVAPDDLALPGGNALFHEVAERLRSIHVAEMMLEEDLILTHYVREAMTTPPQSEPETMNN
jgi:hypothetical protein